MRHSQNMVVNNTHNTYRGDRGVLGVGLWTPGVIGDQTNKAQVETRKYFLFHHLFIFDEFISFAVQHI